MDALKQEQYCYLPHRTKMQILAGGWKRLWFC